jgi:hypothetical protein
MSVHHVILYIPPYLLPEKSWKVLMNNLENHFGDDASIDKEENQTILTFLLKNSAEKSTMEAAVKLLASIKNKDIIAISDTLFWKNTHNEIPKETFKHKKIKTKANCKVCHSDIEKGLIEDENISNINTFR